MKMLIKIILFIFSISVFGLLLSDVSGGLAENDTPPCVPTTATDGLILGDYTANELTNVLKTADKLIACADELGLPEDNYIRQLAATLTEDAENRLDWLTADNERKAYLFLTKTAGLNDAAACGVMANLWVESQFTADTDGLFGYGLCQWCYGRKIAVQDYEQTFADQYEGQLNFLLCELEGAYSDVFEVLSSVPNTKDGAKTAAKEFCRHFEIPVAMSFQSYYRADFAEEYFAKYHTEEADT